ncbi:MAG: hypothetical protein AABY32_07055 [Nanoarchaeota archaeon]
MVKREYKTKIELKGEQAYDEVSHFLNEISFGMCYMKDGVKYSLDIKNKEAIAKLNQKKNTIELTDKVEDWIVESINHINKIENAGKERI